MRVASTPLIRMPVYPIPFPASEFATTEGVRFRRKGRSWPWLSLVIAFLSRLVLVKGARSPARTALTSTGDKIWKLSTGGLSSCPNADWNAQILIIAILFIFLILQLKNEREML